MTEKLTEQDLLDIGFKPVQHFTVANNYTYDLGRRRHLSIGRVGTPNEMLLICEKGYGDDKEIKDLVGLHNYDFDGYLKKEKLQTLIDSIGKSTKTLGGIETEDE